MKNIKTAILILFVIISVSLLAAGCSRKENSTTTKTDSVKTTNNSESRTNAGNKDISNMDSENKEHAMIDLPTMQCNTCKKNIEEAVNKVSGVMNITVDKNKKVAHVHYDKTKTDLEKIESAITSAGYDANDKKRDMKAYENLDDCCKIPKDQKDPGQH